jgi:hypothetical protein
MGRLILHVDREAIPNGAASGGGQATKRLLVTVQ